ncbi:hypothetical protein [Pseudomonas sp.]|uniref:hypothetical protein n=1 Tax=Pseudomonas sp. TaxID=306 RepID=UPI003BAFDAE0
MARTSIYDRISEKRLAAEALARQQADQAALEPPASEHAQLPAAPGLALEPGHNALKIAGLNLLIPQGFNFRDIDTTLEVSGHPVTLSARRRPAPEGLNLQHALELYVSKLRQRHPDITLVRRAECQLVGHPAIALDYLYSFEQERRHGRAVCTLIAAVKGNEHQWFSLATVINPDHARLADWLIEFDAMLADINAH